MRITLAALLALLAVTAAACGGGKSAAAPTVTTVAAMATDATGETLSVTTHGRFHYPPVIVDNFMRSCTKTGNGREAYCSCTLDELSNNVSSQDLTRIGLAGGSFLRGSGVSSDKQPSPAPTSCSG